LILISAAGNKSCSRDDALSSQLAPVSQRGIWVTRSDGRRGWEIAGFLRSAIIIFFVVFIVFVFFIFFFFVFFVVFAVDSTSR
jgi:hypothetical protein